MPNQATATLSSTAPLLRVPAHAPVAAAASEPDVSWDLLLVCVGGYILTAVGRIHQLFPLLDLIRPTIITGLLAITLYLVDHHGSRRVGRLWFGTTKWLVALLVWMVLSVPGALLPGNSFYLVVDNFAKTAVMYLVIAGAPRGIRDLERLAGMYLLAAATYATIVISRFELGAGEDWRLGHLYYYDANDFATFAVSATPLVLYFAHRGRRPVIKMLALAALAVLALAFVRSGSRGGFVALMAMGGYIVLRYTAVRLRWRLSALALVGLVLVVTASDTYWRQMGTILSDTDYNHTEESGRLQIWRRGVGYMLQHPILGVGPNNFAAAEGMLSPFAERQQFGVGVRWNAPHNSFVQVGAELGVPGLVIFVAILVSAFSALRRSGRVEDVTADRQARERELAQALTASLIAFVFGAFFLTLAYSEILYTLVALAAGLKKVTTAPDADDDRIPAFPLRSLREAR